MLSLIEAFLPLAALVLTMVPLVWVAKKDTRMNPGKKLLAQVCLFFGVFLLVSIFELTSIRAADEEVVNAITGTVAQGAGFISAALAVGFSSLGAGIAVAAAAPAAIGAISENGDNFGKAMIFVALGEGVAIYGVLVAILIINKL
ncbi:MAG: ATP synthase subunit C [Erysipelotrichaceae bacterium]|nr:ATP synthase subunit C [Erysipelotrichaceae bacterium]